MCARLCLSMSFCHAKCLNTARPSGKAFLVF
uniref:Uncharacterized protein n=1 Tax=Arundo donax TaxID=35708 RepID=A0A0A9GXK0_ARUDO